jgi:glutathione peroxidase-family protein
LKVKANKLFNSYRNLVLGLPVKEFRSLQAGKTVEISQSHYDKFKHIYEVIKKDVEVKDGD